MKSFFQQPMWRHATAFATITVLFCGSAVAPVAAKQLRLPFISRQETSDPEGPRSDANKGETESKHALRLPFFGAHKATEPSQSCQVESMNVRGQVKIQASPELVWQAIHEERAKDPDLAYSKVVEQISATEYKLEQKFNFIPIVGTSVCLMHHKETPMQRIDYHLLHSDRFKAMHGSWVLTPCEEGKATMLELSSHLDMGLPVPRALMNSVSSKKIEHRLSHVKEMAEAAAGKIAEAKRNVRPE